MDHLLSEDLEHVLLHTADLWEEIRGRKIFITGGTGFFGCWLLESFIYANEKHRLKAYATVLTRNPEAFKKKASHLAFHPAIKFHVGDVKTFHFPKEEFSHIIHASNEAANYIRKNDSPGNVQDAIIQAARHVLEFARLCGASHFLFTSSGTVYGPQPSNLMHLPETYEGIRDASHFRFAHGEGKFRAEILCSQYAEKYSIAAKIARCFTFVGPYMQLDANYAIGNFIRDGLNGGPIKIKGDGTPCRSYMYAADLAIWLWTILIKGKSSRSYNVGSMEHITILDIAKLVSQQFPAPIDIIMPKVQNPAGERVIYIPDTTRARDELKLYQWIPLKESLRRTIDFFKHIR
jgi:nucleoside-diphosphate-sugar epimerase